MKKIIYIILIILIIFLPTYIFASENAYEDNALLMDEIYEQIDLNNLELYANDSFFYELTGFNSIKDFVFAVSKGEYVFSFENLFTKIKELFISKLGENISLIGSLLLLSILCSVVNLMGSSFMNEKISKIAFFAIYLSFASLLIKTFFSIISTSSQLITALISYMNILLPILILLLSLSGGIFTGGLISPSLIFIINLFSSLINYFAIPITSFGFILSTINPLLDNIDFTPLTSFLKQIILWVMGFFSVMFLGLVSMEGFAFASLDGITAKGAKFAVKNFVPIIGGFLSDCSDTVFGFISLLKNCVGLIATIILISLLLSPLLIMMINIFCFKVVESLSGILNNSVIAKVLKEASSFLTIYFICCVVCFLMFFFLIGIITMLGNYTVMYR